MPFPFQTSKTSGYSSRRKHGSFPMILQVTVHRFFIWKAFFDKLLRLTSESTSDTGGAMDPVLYQLDPAARALKQTRQRILIADAVGLGKTLEAGILISELIKRERGKRILVVTLKSMMTQFQKELWSRFTIPLVRLDSTAIQRVYSSLPSGPKRLQLPGYERRCRRGAFDPKICFCSIVRGK